MDVRFSAEQQALRDSVARAATDLGPGAVGDLDDHDRSSKLDQVVADAGWRDLRGGDDDGAPWASAVEVAIVAEEMGRGLSDTSFMGPTLAAELRRLAGAPPADEVETVLMSSDLAGLATELTGAVAIDSHAGRTALLTLPDGESFRLARVGLGESVTRVDLTRPVADPVGARKPLDGELALGDIERAFALGLATSCADLVGTMQGALDLAAGYAAERHQYGQPVGSFQAVQHLLADALVLTEGSRSLARHAAWAVDALPPTEALTAAATAKAYAARGAREVCETCIQVHGGIGNTWECLAHVFLRRALFSTDLFGGVEASLDRVLRTRLASSQSDPVV